MTLLTFPVADHGILIGCLEGISCILQLCIMSKRIYINLYDNLIIVVLLYGSYEMKVLSNIVNVVDTFSGINIASPCFSSKSYKYVSG